MYTKRLIVEMVFDELALAGYTFDITPDETTAMLRRLDLMMATWGMNGIRVGYNSTVDPSNVDPDQDSGLPDWAVEAVYLNCAIRGAASFGKSLAKSTTAAAKMAYDIVVARCVDDNTVQLQNMGNLPAGAGWKQRTRPFVRPPQDYLTTGPDGPLEFNGVVPV